ncbi:glycosyltransferase family 4 protein [Brucepastera parasyntrophica]|uniref:glycosyltransferase family 4 protein n=1 Tax=Brucepastera parasyntrophica TaxID=2880008 RepID=UPI00210B262E|nr:glycosyltransferase family 4 protein [Brucepastera parasyntrophica]ULQ60054.1 glycosyltransferase family 4 protein [Brucepastera parasyntrophica]
MKRKLVMISANTAWNIYSRKRLLLAMKNAGWEVITLADPDKKAAEIETDLHIRFIPLPMKSDGTNLIRDFRLFLRYISLYRRYKPLAALHINNKPNIYGTLASNILGIRSAANITGLGVVEEKKGLTRFIVHSLYRLVFSSRKSFVFFQNNDDREFFLEHRLVAAERTYVLPGSGVDLSAFSPSPEEKRDKKIITFLFNGRLLITKGIRDYISAAIEVRKLYPDTVFIVIGEYDKDNSFYLPWDELENAKKSGIIKYLGFVEQVQPYIREADCVVHPSYYREGVPRVLLEGAAMGKPLIAADSPGTRDPVENGVNGFLTIPGDRESLKSAMLRFISSSESEKKQMGFESRKIAETRFSDSIIINAYLKRLEDIYKKAEPGNGSGSG